MMTPLGECRSSAPSPQAGREEEGDGQLPRSPEVALMVNSPSEIPDTKTWSFPSAAAMHPGKCSQAASVSTLLHRI